MVRSRDWNEILESYRDLNMSIMAEFVEQIIASQYIHGIYAATSMHMLWISQHSEFEIDKNMLRIEFANDNFEFIYKESHHSNRKWRKEADLLNGFTTFEHIMKRLKWFLN